MLEGANRRQHPRAKNPDVIARLVTANGDAVICSVADISAGGARLISAVPARAGDRTSIVFTAPGRQPIAVTASIVRVEPLDSQLTFVAAKFESVADPIQRTIQAIVLRALEREQLSARRTVLVVDADATQRGSLERNLNALGCAAISVASAVDARRALDDPSEKIVIAFVAGGIEGGDELAEFLAANRPAIRCERIVEPITRPRLRELLAREP